MTATERVRHDLAIFLSPFPLIVPVPFLLVKVSDSTQDMLNRAAAKQKARAFTGAPITAWGAL